MPVYFFDTSALLKHYIREQGTEWVNSVLNSSANDCVIARVTMVESVAAIARRAKGGDLTSRQTDVLLGKLSLELASRFIIIEISPAVVDRAVILARMHALRGYDAIQLAAAVETRSVAGLEELIFVSADDELNEAAIQSGLATINPSAPQLS